MPSRACLSAHEHGAVSRQECTGCPQQEHTLLDTRQDGRGGRRYGEDLPRKDFVNLQTFVQRLTPLLLLFLRNHTAYT